MHSFMAASFMVNAFIHGSIIIDPSRRGGTYGGQVHVTGEWWRNGRLSYRLASSLMQCADWLPTLLGLATNKQWRGSYIPGTVIDGKDIWDAIINDTPSPREEIVLYYSKANNATSKTDDFVYQKNNQKVINMHQNPNYSSTLLLFDPNQPNPTQTQCVNPQWRKVYPSYSSDNCYVFLRQSIGMQVTTVATIINCLLQSNDHLCICCFMNWVIIRNNNLK